MWAKRTMAWLAVAIVLCLCPAWPQSTNTAETPFLDDPVAHQLYQEMIQAMRKATTLSWTGENRMEDSRTVGHHMALIGSGSRSQIMPESR